MRRESVVAIAFLIYRHLIPIDGFVIKLASRKRRLTQHLAALETDNELLIVPIFPLRKKIRLPTEKLTLNLYEDRYLKLAKRVMEKRESSSQFFGAVYASNKPQVVACGSAPIVPMMEPGDLGVICVVTNDQHAMVPTPGGELRSRIRLEATAAIRFRIHRILHNGYGGSPTGETPLPYILAEARTFTDKDVDVVNEGCVEESLDENDSLGSNELDELAIVVRKSIKRDICLDDYRRELARFLNASQSISEGASKDRLKCLTNIVG